MKIVIIGNMNMGFERIVSMEAEYGCRLAVCLLQDQIYQNVDRNIREIIINNGIDYQKMQDIDYEAL